MAEIKAAVGKSKGAEEEKLSSSGLGPGLFSFTIDASTGQITGLEKVDSAGARRQLSEQDKASLQASMSSHTLKAIVEQAFEAGIACVLGDGEDDAQESEGDAEVRRTLLMPLIEGSRSVTLLSPKFLAQAMLATALQQVSAIDSSEASGSSSQQKPAEKPHQSGSAGSAQH